MDSLTAIFQFFQLSPVTLCPNYEEVIALCNQDTLANFGSCHWRGSGLKPFGR